jgi:heme oxygenase
MMGPHDDEEPRVHVSLAARLREETHELHRDVERHVFMRALLRGALDRQAYVLLLRSLHGVYAALEAGLDRHAADPRLAPFAEPALRRRTPIESDLQALAGPAWPRLQAPEAAARYAARLNDLTARQPLLLAAHAYVRYLGDLSGGQLLAGIVERSVGGATAFYAFGDATTSASRAGALRHGLDALGSDAAVADAVVAEARAAFARHGDLFDELALRGGLVAAPLGAA